MDRDRGDLQLGTQCPLVQRFNVAEFMDVLQRAGIDLPLGQCVEHERVVRVRAMGNSYDPAHGLPLSALVLNSSRTGWCSRYSTRFVAICDAYCARKSRRACASDGRAPWSSATSPRTT